MINTVSVTNLKQNTANVIKKVKESGEPLVVIQRSEPAAVILDPKIYEIFEKALEDLEDLRDIKLRKNESTVSLNKYLKKRFRKTRVK